MSAGTKQELLNEAAREYKAFHEAIQGLNEEQLREPWLGTWSIREILGHLSGWHREMGRAVERVARGERPVPEGVSYDDVDAWNRRFAEAVRDTPAADLLLELDRTHQHFMQIAAAVPDDRFQPGKTVWRIVDQITAHHYREHADQIRAWRTSRGV